MGKSRARAIPPRIPPRNPPQNLDSNPKPNHAKAQFFKRKSKEKQLRTVTKNQLKLLMYLPLQSPKSTHHTRRDGAPIFFFCFPPM